MACAPVAAITLAAMSVNFEFMDASFKSLGDVLKKGDIPIYNALVEKRFLLVHFKMSGRSNRQRALSIQFAAKPFA
ncbi:hypothetical protein [Teredinibacter turnerae]|uniref:hypothetical protein n=1 Tax=Teredinibacter turnerae TaxID=2426 RepID=UPI0030CAC51E